LFFAVYGDIVYHHGAGFRDNVLSRVDRERLKAQYSARRLLRSGRLKAVERNNQQSRLVFEAIQGNDPDWLADVTDDVALERSS
jgi:uncharacterized protein YciI